MSRYINNKFNSKTKTTVGLEFAPKEIIKGNSKLKLNIMDTAGQERFDAISNIFYRNAIGALLVFDVTDKYSFDTLDSKL